MLLSKVPVFDNYLTCTHLQAHMHVHVHVVSSINALYTGCTWLVNIKFKILNKFEKKTQLVFFVRLCRLELPSTGRTVDCLTTEPCMETYFSCAMRTMKGKNGASYGAYENGGICLIPMQYTSAVNMVCSI